MTKKSVRKPSTTSAPAAASIPDVTSTPATTASPESSAVVTAQPAPKPGATRRSKAAPVTPVAKPARGRKTSATTAEATSTEKVIKKPAARKTALRKPAATPAPSATAVPPLTQDVARAERTPATGLRVLIVASECSPYVNSGNLGDAVGALVDSLAAGGHDVTCVLPRFPGVLPEGAAHDQRTVTMGDRAVTVTLIRGDRGPHARVIAVDHEGFFGRPSLYAELGQEYPDNPRRFAVLAMVACDLAAEAAVPYDVIHAFDWQAGLVPVLARARAADSPHLACAALVFTAHAPQFQGRCASDWLTAFGLDARYRSVVAMEYWGGLSLLKGGVNFADIVTVGSAEDAVTSPGGWGFEGIFAARGSELVSLDLHGETSGIGQRAVDLYDRARTLAAMRGPV